MLLYFDIIDAYMYPCILDREWEKELDEELRSFEVVSSTNNDLRWKTHPHETDEFPDLK